jgi:hypothetical protein
VKGSCFAAAIVAMAISTQGRAQFVASGLEPSGKVCVQLATAGSPTERSLLAAAALAPTFTATTLRPLWKPDAESISRSGKGEERCSGTRWIGPAVRVWYNTSSANPERDGAVWQGRGITLAGTAGVRGRIGAVTMAFQPLVGVAENAPFPPAGDAQQGDFRDPYYGSGIDLPYRFGNGAQLFLDPGESHFGIEWRRIGIGITSAAQHWGPAHFYPLVIGTEAAGYPRAFAETRRFPIGLGSLVGNWQVGLLRASEQSMRPAGEDSRVGSAAMFAFIPRGLAGLEIGGTRFFHVRREAGTLGWSTATLPFSGVLKKSSRDTLIGGFNQLASAFLRMAPPQSGIELYGEFYREDHSVDLRDLLAQPDHASAFSVGLQRTRRIADQLRVFTIEHVNSRISHLARRRGQSVIYIHSALVEGHTFRGQPLGSLAAMGGGATMVAWHRSAASRSSELELEVRTMAQDPDREGGTRRGVPSGAYFVRGGRRRLTERGVIQTWAQLQIGYGRTPRSNLTLGAGWQR